MKYKMNHGDGVTVSFMRRTVSRKLALSDEILMSVDKPARYIGGEVNSVMKDKSEVEVRFAFAFPDVYDIGMAHLGIQILYDMFNSWSDVWCERVYSPWPDLDSIMRDRNIPLFTLESQDPVRDFDFLGITLQYEMCYTNILQILDLAGIPVRATDRTDGDPIVIGGGPCSYNPEPIADFFDVFYIGEGETRYRELIDAYRECSASGMPRADILKRICLIPGMYVPSLYREEYNDDGTIRGRIKLYEEAPDVIVKELVTDLSDTYYPRKPLVPLIQTAQDRITLEIQRGCIRGCRFCQAGQLYRPVRERDPEYLKQLALDMMDSTGIDEMTLSSLSSSDYSHLEELIGFLIDECGKRHVNISLPSLRIDAFSLDVMSKVQDIRKSSLTFAPEAGSQRMRNIINKGLTKDDIINGATQAFLGGWTRVKLYFMLGLPFETDEDIEAIGELSNDVAAAFFDTVPKEKRREPVQIVTSTSFFIPKPFTPLQWAPMADREEFVRKAHVCLSGIHSQLNQKRIKYNWHDTDTSELEGILARGDRRICDLIQRVYEKGAIFDAWTEYFKYDTWLEAMNELGIDRSFYTTRERADDEIFPWDFIDAGIQKSFLLREWHRAREGAVTPNCRDACSGCGAARFKCGICLTDRTGTSDIPGSGTQTTDEALTAAEVNDHEA